MKYFERKVECKVGDNKQKIDKNFSCLDLEKKSKREKRECVS